MPVYRQFRLCIKKKGTSDLAVVYCKNRRLGSLKKKKEYAARTSPRQRQKKIKQYLQAEGQNSELASFFSALHICSIGTPNLKRKLLQVLPVRILDCVVILCYTSL